VGIRRPGRRMAEGRHTGWVEGHRRGQRGVRSLPVVGILGPHMGWREGRRMAEGRHTGWVEGHRRGQRVVRSLPVVGILGPHMGWREGRRRGQRRTGAPEGRAAAGGRPAGRRRLRRRALRWAGARQPGTVPGRGQGRHLAAAQEQGTCSATIALKLGCRPVGGSSCGAEVEAAQLMPPRPHVLGPAMMHHASAGACFTRHGRPLHSAPSLYHGQQTPAPTASQGPAAPAAAHLATVGCKLEVQGHSALLLAVLPHHRRLHLMLQLLTHLHQAPLHVCSVSCIG
jgi:hypothetical protein